MNTFTPQQIARWRDYEKLRRTGSILMVSVQAREALGMSSVEHLFTIVYYEALRSAALSPEKDRAIH